MNEPIRAEVTGFHHTEKPQNLMEKAPGSMTYVPQACMDCVVVEVETPDGVRECVLPNAGWKFANPWLQLLAWADCSPSTSDELVGKEVPMDVNDNGDWMIHKSVFRQGSELLESDETEWMLSAAEAQ